MGRVNTGKHQPILSSEKVVLYDTAGTNSRTNMGLSVEPATSKSRNYVGTSN